MEWDLDKTRNFWDGDIVQQIALIPLRGLDIPCWKDENAGNCTTPLNSWSTTTLEKTSHYRFRKYIDMEATYEQYRDERIPIKASYSFGPDLSSMPGGYEDTVDHLFVNYPIFENNTQEGDIQKVNFTKPANSLCLCKDMHEENLFIGYALVLAKSLSEENIPLAINGNMGKDQ